MAAPTRNAFLALTGNAGATTYTPSIATLRTGCLARDVIILFIATDGNPTLTLGGTSAADGWVIMNQTASGTACKLARLRYAVAVDGSAPDPTINLSASEAITGHGIRVRPTAGMALSFHASVAPATGAATANPNPAAVANGSGAAQDSYFVAHWAGDGIVLSTVAPTNYANHQSQAISNAANGCSIGTADRTIALANAASEDPAVFTRVAEDWAAATVGLYESTPVGGLIKIWGGGGWAEKPVKAWTGAAWVQKPVKAWNGSAWVLS
jgi:hypothetical protein